MCQIKLLLGLFYVIYVYLFMCAFIVLIWFIQYCAKRLARKNVSEMTYFVSSGRY